MKQMFTRKKILYLQVVSLLVLFAGCEKATIQFGQTYIDNGSTNIVLVDTMTVGVSTVFKDSVITSNEAVILVGNAQDPYFGQITSSSYLSLVPNTNTIPDFLYNVKYDSAALLMKSNTDYYGDTTSAPTFSVKQLNTQILLPDQQFYFYNTSSFPLSPAPALGSTTFSIRPSAGDSVRIRMDATGSTLFNMMLRKSDTIKNNTLFTAWFKGLQIASNPTDKVVYGFKDSVVLRLYYHQTDLYLEKKSFDFTLNNSNFQFNNISANRAGTNLTALSHSNSEVPSAQTGNIGYSQSATGLYMKISFPTLKGLIQRLDYTKVISAQLIIKPLPGSYTGQFVLPPQLVAASTDALNEPGGLLATTSGGTAVTETGNLNLDLLNGNNTTYSYDVTSYLISQIASINSNLSIATGLLLIPPSASRYSSLKRVVIGDNKNPNQFARVQLKVYYISVNP